MGEDLQPLFSDCPSPPNFNPSAVNKLPEGPIASPFMPEPVSVVADTLSVHERKELLRAYRDTFKDESQGKSLSALYDHFSRKFGVDVERLRELVLQDMKDNRKLYVELRSGLASRQAAKTPSTAPKASPQRGDDKAAAKKHACRICGQLILVNRRGALHPHHAKGRDGMVVCPGAGLIVASPKGNGRRIQKRTGIDPVNRALPASSSAATTGRLNATAKSNAQGAGKIIGGGSPGLGKRAR